ncbi:MAG: hypothetical protein A3H28_02900 [Acidobacteria bacterium RIFCSPLOWO2_02_FULL_61_28]|nr:MAG: hypothetical protein A3H28_02900 [Acidobacteria bacterium RIFCSPLOWO2_02_FULL_61_28]
MWNLVRGGLLGVLIFTWVCFLGIQPGYWSREAIHKRSEWKTNRSTAKELFGMIGFGVFLLFLSFLMWVIY